MDLDWKKNLGTTDRMLRIVIGVLLLALAYSRILTGGWATAAVVFGLFQFIEAAFAY